MTLTELKPQPEWQKALILLPPDNFPHLKGKEVWVKTGPPSIGEGYAIDGRPTGPRLSVICALSSWEKPYLTRCPVKDLNGDATMELLGIFAPVVTPVPFAVWGNPDWKGDFS
jgi:hypothetical protein